MLLRRGRLRRRSGRYRRYLHSRHRTCHLKHTVIFSKGMGIIFKEQMTKRVIVTGGGFLRQYDYLYGHMEKLSKKLSSHSHKYFALSY